MAESDVPKRAGPRLRLPEPRNLVRAVVLTLAALMAGSLAFDAPSLLVACAAISAALTLTIVLVGASPKRRRRATVTCDRPLGDKSDRYWDAQIFTYALASAVIMIAALMWPGLDASILVVVCIALALINALTPFCIGRWLFLVLFGQKPEGR